MEVRRGGGMGDTAKEGKMEKEAKRGGRRAAKWIEPFRFCLYPLKLDRTAYALRRLGGGKRKGGWKE